MLTPSDAPRPPVEAEPTDQSLAIRAAAGEREAFGLLVERYQVSVFNVCYRLLGERHAAEDLAQEAFVRAYQRLDRFDRERPFGPWIRRLAANVCLNHLEAQRPRALALDDEHDTPLTAPPAVDPAAVHEQAEADAAVRAALISLPPHYRAVIELRHFQDLTYEEIATALGLPVSDVKSHLFRARRRLAQKLSALASRKEA
jgi:RNA polymerase sigma-70 factor (ECF subfamily)